MLELVRPRAFIPVHGTRHHLDRHAALAREVGVPEVLVLENGQVAEIGAASVARAGTVPSGRVYTFGGRAIPKAALRDREVLAEGGVVSCVVVLGADGRARDVRIATRGVMDETIDLALLKDARHDVLAAVSALSSRARDEDAAVAEAARLAVRRTLSRALAYKPMTIAHVIRAGQGEAP